jgi:hypothetical protein
LMQSGDKNEGLLRYKCSMFMLLMWLLLLLLLLLLMWLLLLLHSSCTACFVDNIECSSNRRWVSRVTCATTNAALLHP